MTKLLFILSAAVALSTGRQTPGINLVRTNSYKQSQPIRRQISTGYGAPPPSQSAPDSYGQPSAPACQTTYEEKCEDVEDVECTNVTDEICDITQEEKCETVQDRRCSVTYSKSCQPSSSQKCGDVVDVINEQSCESRTEKKCSKVRHPVCHVMKDHPN